MFRSAFLSASAAAIVGLTVLSASAAEMRPILTLEVAQKMANACLAMAKAESWPMHVSIMDNHGNLKFYARMDDTALLPQKISMMKAETSAGFPVSTKQISNFGFADGAPTPFAFVPGLIFFEGGVPIMAGTAHIGAIGVSGSSAENDGKCAQAGIDAVAGDLSK
ncbi:MAG: heme-binding protein [Proteobacteria bacterium]|nr:heme-binding protein [Pseudomonadota bacterium]